MVAFLSGYLTILGTAWRAIRADGITLILPSLPPQGHVPALVSHQLGNAFTNSNVYDLWLRFGTVFGLVAPTALLGRYLLLGDKQLEAARLCARPLFLLCCQAASESISRRAMVRQLMIAKQLSCLPSCDRIIRPSDSVPDSEGPAPDSYTCSYCL